MIDRAYHLLRARDLIERLGIPGMPVWEKITPSRAKIITARMSEESWSSICVFEFWDSTCNHFLPFDISKVENWSICTLEVLLRVPQRGTTDHYQLAVEGGYRDHKAIAEAKRERGRQERMKKLLAPKPQGEQMSLEDIKAANKKRKDDQLKREEGGE